MRNRLALSVVLWDRGIALWNLAKKWALSIFPFTRIRFSVLHSRRSCESKSNKYFTPGFFVLHFRSLYWDVASKEPKK